MYTFTRQDKGLEPLIHYSGTQEHPVQWIQFLHAVDQPDLPGFPVLTPVNIQMLKCEKCSLEFSSPINYRRHCRIHRRSLKDNKESHNIRGLLSVFWDKCSLSERKQILSFDDIMIKKIPGSSVIEALAAALLEPGVWILPHIYLKAGSKLLDIVQARLPIMSISSQDLFSILDDASEGTFLCAGAADYIQNFVFDVGVANGLEFKNLIASTSFLFELQLLKAWVADKDAEALRCQKLLVEEEEAARKRQAKLVQRRKQKKLRHREQLYAYKQDMNAAVSPADEKTLAEESIPSTPSEYGSSSANGPVYCDIHIESFELDSNDFEEHSEVLNETGEFVDLRDSEPFGTHEEFSGRQSPDMQHQHVSNSQRESLHSLMENQDIGPEHDEVLEKSILNSDASPQILNSGGNNKSEIRNECLNDHRVVNQQTEACNFKVLIGSISVPLNNYTISQRLSCPVDTEYEVHENLLVFDGCASEKIVKGDGIPCSANHNFLESEIEGNSLSEGMISSETENRDIQDDIPAESQSKNMDESDQDKGKQHAVVSDGNAPFPFSTAMARDFLTQRWKQAISTDHIKLSLGPELGPETTTEV